MGFRLVRSEKRKADLEKALKEFTARLAETDVRKVILFGSLARGDVGSKSDVDLVLIRDSDEPFVRRGDDLVGLFPPGLPADILVYTPQEWENLAANNPSYSESRKKGLSSMKPDYREEARRWYRQAERDLDDARFVLEGGRFSGGMNGDC